MADCDFLVILLSMHYINGWCRIVVAVNLPMRVESMHGHALTFSEQVIANNIYDIHCGMSDDAFRTVRPIGGFSCLNISETTRASNFKMYRDVSTRQSLHFDRKRHHDLLPIGSKSHKRVNFGSYSGRDYLITVLWMSTRFTVLERVIQEFHPVLCDAFDIFTS